MARADLGLFRKPMPISDNDREDVTELQTCRQRIKERELYITRLEDRIRRSGGIIRDFETDPDFNFQESELGSSEIDNITQTLLGQIEVANSYQRNIEALEASLKEQEASDPSDKSGNGKKLREKIARIRLEEVYATKICEEKKSELKDAWNNLKFELEAKRAKARQCKKENELLKAQNEKSLAGQASDPTALTAEVPADRAKLVAEARKQEREIYMLEEALEIEQGKAASAHTDVETQLQNCMLPFAFGASRDGD
jgi:hypothetical protein